MSKPDCPLCLEAQKVVVSVFGDERVKVVNIVGNRELEDQYIFRIPVLLYNDRAVAEGHITPADAKAARRRVLDLANR